MTGIAGASVARLRQRIQRTIRFPGPSKVDEATIVAITPALGVLPPVLVRLRRRDPSY